MYSGNLLTIVSHWLVGLHDNRVALSRLDIKLVNRQGLVLDTISFDNGHVVAINREGESKCMSNISCESAS